MAEHLWVVTWDATWQLLTFSLVTAKEAMVGVVTASKTILVVVTEEGSKCIVSTQPEASLAADTAPSATCIATTCEQPKSNLLTAVTESDLRLLNEWWRE